LRVASTPDLDSIGIRINDILKVGSHSCAIGRGATAWQTDSLGDVEDYACEAIFVKVDFLVVGDLTDCAFWHLLILGKEGGRGRGT